MRYGNYNWCGPNSWGIDTFWGFPFFHGPFGFILTLLFWGIVIWTLIRIIQGVYRALWQKDSDPLMILKRRYACGEITGDEFNSMKKQL